MHFMCLVWLSADCFPISIAAVVHEIKQLSRLEQMTIQDDQALYCVKFHQVFLCILIHTVSNKNLWWGRRRRLTLTREHSYGLVLCIDDYYPADYWRVSITLNQFPCSHRNFVSCVIHHSRSLGMSISEPVAIECKRRDQSAEVFFNTLIETNSNLELIMAVLPKKGSGSGYGRDTYTIYHQLSGGNNPVSISCRCIYIYYFVSTH